MLLKIDVILLITVFLIGISTWVLVSPHSSSLSYLDPQTNPLRHAMGGGFAVLVACLIAHFWSKRWALRHGWALPSLLGGIILITLASALWAPRTPYFPWWQGSVGCVVSMLVLVGGLTYALPRLDETISNGETAWKTKTIGSAPFLGVLVFAAMAPFVLYHNWSVMLVLLFGVLILTALTVLQGPSRIVAVSAAAAALIGRVVILEWSHGTVTELISHMLGSYSNWHRNQIRLVIQGGAEAPFLLEWHTDLILVRLLDIGGLPVGLGVMVLVGAWITLLWRIVGRQSDLRMRTLAASIASVLTIRSLLSVFISTGLWPVSGIPFPFLSYGVRVMMIDGFLLALLLVLNRDCEGSPQERRSVVLIQMAVWAFLILCGGILLGVFLGYPGRFSV